MEKTAGNMTSPEINLSVVFVHAQVNSSISLCSDAKPKGLCVSCAKREISCSHLTATPLSARTAPQFSTGERSHNNPHMLHHSPFLVSPHVFLCFYYCEAHRVADGYEMCYVHKLSLPNIVHTTK